MRRHQKSAFYCQLQCQGCAGWVNRRRVMWTCSSACQHEQHHCDPGSPLLVLLKRDQKDWQGQDTAQDNYSLGCSLWKKNAISLESSFFCVKALWLVDGCSFMQKLSLSGRTVLMGTMVGAADCDTSPLRWLLLVTSTFLCMRCCSITWWHHMLRTVFHVPATGVGSGGWHCTDFITAVFHCTRGISWCFSLQTITVCSYFSSSSKASSCICTSAEWGLLLRSYGSGESNSSGAVFPTVTLLCGSLEMHRQIDRDLPYGTVWWAECDALEVYIYFFFFRRTQLIKTK